MAADVVLRTRGLTKRFGKRVAVHDVSITVRENEVYGLLGPNGSGKSTIIGMILGLVHPTAGSIEVFGLPFPRERWTILRQVGAIIEAPAFYPYLSGRDNLRVLARPLGLEQNVDGALDRVRLLERADDRYDDYSLGMKQRLGIASTLVRDPRLIVLDEPTNGLDPAGTREIRELIPQLATGGRAVVLSSHLLHEVEQVCDTVAILYEGVLRREDRLENLLHPEPLIELHMGDGHGTADVRAALAGLEWVQDIREAADGALTITAPHNRTGDLNRTLFEHGMVLDRLEPVHPSLERVFLEITGKGEQE
ncbi:MAG TPA: ABC transporter ATP-binding protein [Tepidiformaceae bacterium]|nr:ABC transporter ATP-binding protein [Tepidiformaceae bacterium]